MPQQLQFTCPLRTGLHARPASRLVEIARGFEAACELINVRSGARADAKSVLALLAADVGAGDSCAVDICGGDEAAARAAIDRFLRSELPAYDEDAPPVTTEAPTSLPRTLAESGASWWRGLAVSAGLGLGRVVMAGVVTCGSEDVADRLPVDPDSERQILTRAIDVVRTRIEARLIQHGSAAEAAILTAHAAMVTDPLLRASLDEAIAAGRSAAGAIVDAAERFTSMVAASRTPALRDRAADVQGICVQLLDEVCGTDLAHRMTPPTEPSVLVGESLTPQQLLDLDPRFVAGIVLETAATTSHAVILARSLGIPTILGVDQARSVLTPGTDAVVDGHRGVVVTRLTPTARQFYDRELTRLRARQAVMARATSGPVSTVDGRRLDVGANVSTIEELDEVGESGADGIGLFRTEMLFLRAAEPPSEDEQFDIYRAAVQAMRGRAIVIRTLDPGGDKPVAAVPTPDEPNPFLGYRGVRTYVEHQDLIRSQLRAIARASAVGPVRLLVPMVSSIEEVLWVKAQVARVQDELAACRVPFDRDMPIGIMLEVPAVSFVLDRLCEEVDFFSIGTNDLCQYFFAADRGNTRVAPLASVTHPGFLRFLKNIVDEVRSRGRAVGLCGEMAGDVRQLPLLVGLGLDGISAAADRIPALKTRLARLSDAECTVLLADALACRSSDGVEALLDAAIDRPRPLVDADIVCLDGSCATREEAIRMLVDALYASGRTDDPCVMEDAIWRRELRYPTVVGDGIAVPHCQSDAVTSDSIGILRLNAPVDWTGDGSTPVRMVFLLATRMTSPNHTHMHVFSQLARRLMDAGFREHVLSTADPMTVVDRLSTGWREA